MFTHLSFFAASAIALLPLFSFGQESLLVSHDAVWSYHAARDSPPSDWRSLEFEADDWSTGRAGFGYGDGDDATQLTEMRSRFSRVQIRTGFLIDNPKQADSLYLYVNFDDGFVASINGREVVRRNVVDPNQGLAAGNHEVKGFEEFVVPNASSLLKNGRNVLAVEGFNRTVDSSDFSLHPVLSRRREEHLKGRLLRVRSTGRPSDSEARRNSGEQPSVLSHEQAIADVNELQRRLEDQSSYVRRDRFDRHRAFNELRESVGEQISVLELTSRLQRLIARIGDCHARVDSPMRNADASFLPFMIADAREGIAALKPDRSALIDPACPYVLAIDGIPIDRWLEVAASYVADGSPQLIRHRSLALVRRVDSLRGDLQIPHSDQVTVSLRSREGEKVHKHAFDLISSPSPYGRVPIARTRLLDGNIGYLRIEKMDNSLEKTISQSMQGFRETRGLIIDVRDNGGGRYGIMRLMHGYLTPPDAKSYVTNIAAYRKSELFAEDHIHYRPTFRESYGGWDDRQREAIRNAREAFKPEWTPSPDLFSEWHYMVLDKTPGVGQYYYDKPVVVLCNAGSFSATDGFLSCMADIPEVILLGESSGGGSGATRRFTLPRSGIRIALSSMASFRPDGKLFDGNGVEVDIVMKPTLGDFQGKSDTVRTRAMEIILSND